MELSATRLYASSIAIVSGVYSLVAAGGALTALGIGGVIMVVVGLIVRGVGWDPGMVAIAVLMLASGLIMSRQRSTGGM